MSKIRMGFKLLVGNFIFFFGSYMILCLRKKLGKCKPSILIFCCSLKYVQHILKLIVASSAVSVRVVGQTVAYKQFYSLSIFPFAK